MLAEQILVPPDGEPWLFAHHLQRFKVQVQRRSQSSGEERSTELSDHKTVSCGKGELSSRKSHMLLDQNQLRFLLAGEWGSAVLLAARESLTGFVFQSLCSFKLDNGAVGISCVGGGAYIF